MTVDWSTTLVSGSLGMLGGVMSSFIMHWIEKRERNKGIAAAFLADVERIRRMLGPPSESFGRIVVAGTAPLPPRLHEWTRGLVTESAAIDHSLISRFLRLEDLLTNFETIRGLYDEARIESNVQRRSVDDAEARGTPNTDLTQAREILEQMELHSRSLADRLALTRREAHSEMDGIESRLERFHKRLR